MRFLILLPFLLLPCLVQAQESQPPVVARPAVSVISSSALQDVGPWGAAALPDGLSAISSDLWRGSDPQTLGIGFARVSADQRFPSLQLWLRQAVFSGGIAPTTDPEITRARFEAASRLGPAEAAARLIYAVPRLSSDPALAAIAIDAGLRVGRSDTACGLIEAVVNPPQTLGWLESRAACYALNNEPAAANLSVDLARSAGLTDTWLSRAVAATSGAVSAPPPFRFDSGRALALSVRANLKPSGAWLASPDLAGLSALVRTPDFFDSLTPDDQSALREGLAARGGLSASSLPLDLIKAPAEPPPQTTPVSDTDPVPTAPIIAPPIAPIPAQISARILSAASLPLRAMQSRRFVGEIKTVMATQPGLLTLADVPILTEAALWAGDGALARAIVALSPQEVDPRLALVVALYAPGSQPQITTRLLEATSDDPVARRIMLRNIMVAGAAGVPIGEAGSALLQQGLPSGPAGNAGLRLALDLAGQRGAKGEVILLSALALQNEDAINANPETLIGVVTNLTRVGLEAAARDVARDYLLAQLITLPARAPTRARPVAPAPAGRPAATPPPRPTIAPAPPVRAPATRSNPSPARTASPPRPAAAPLQRPAQQPAQAPAQRPAPRVKPSWGTP